MVLRTTNPWETSDLADLVSIDTHKLFISTSGPARKHNDPVILFFTGGGAPCIIYARLQRLLSEHWRVYFHDRSGYDRSERGPDKILTGQQSAIELRELLDRIGVGPPYVLMGHSYGGIVARCFLRLLLSDSSTSAGGGTDAVRGLILADTATELMYELFQPSIPPPALDAIAEGVDWDALTHLRRDMRFSEEEWQRALNAIARTAPATKDEDCRLSARRLAETHQLDTHALAPWPVLVIRCNMAHDFRLLYEDGVARGKGTKEERQDALRFIEKMELFDEQIRVVQIGLSWCNRYVSWGDVGHDDILRRPEEYAREVGWVMARAGRVCGEGRAGGEGSSTHTAAERRTRMRLNSRGC